MRRKGSSTDIHRNGEEGTEDETDEGDKESSGDERGDEPDDELEDDTDEEVDVDGTFFSEPFVDGEEDDSADC
jgi:hypothetical protein